MTPEPSPARGGCSREHRTPLTRLAAGSTAGRPIRNAPSSTRSAYSRARRLRSTFIRARTCPPGCPREVDSVARPFTRIAPRHPNRRCLGSPRAGSPAAIPFGPTALEAILDASGRLMQPTLSKTSTHALAASGAYPAEPVAAAEPDASMARAHFCQRSSLPHRVFSTRRDRQGLVSGVPSPPERTARSRALVPLRTTKTASATAALNDGGFPGPRRLPPAGDPCRARIDPDAHRMHARFDRWRSFTRRVSRFGLARPGRLQPQPKAPTPNAAPPNRLLQPSKSMGTPTGRPVLRTEPAVSARSVTPARAGAANGTTSGADTPYARGQGRHRPAGSRVSLRDESRRGPLATRPSTSCHSPRTAASSGRPEAASFEPRSGFDPPRER
jgi:hypothetical protein